MSRPVPAEELDLIERVISEYTEGLGISALERALALHLPNINRRTLQRRLKRLLQEKRIISEGESIALVYRRGPGIGTSTELPRTGKIVSGIADSYIPMSSEGAIIRDLVRQPRIRRKPVGYQRSFLEDYEPGVTFYLSESLRAQFHEMGRTPVNERIAGTYAREILSRLLIDLSWASSRLGHDRGTGYAIAKKAKHMIKMG